MSDRNNISLPQSTADITLQQWIDFTGTDASKELDALSKEVNKLPDSSRKAIKLTGLMVQSAYNTVAYFNEMPLMQAKRSLSVELVMSLFTPFNNLFTNAVDVDMATWQLPSPELSAQSPITFGQFIDSKIITQSLSEGEQNKWQLLQYICAVYLHKADEHYSDSFIDENNDRFKYMGGLPMCIALKVMDFYERLNSFASANFSLFNDSGEESGKHMRKHFEQWGWVNFLKAIAKTKVYDLPASGMNSIDCVRQAKLYEVLIYASEDKDYSIAYSRDMEAMYSK